MLPQLCGCCPQDVKHCLGSYSRVLWKNKALFCTVCCIIYISVFTGVYTIASAWSLPPGNPLTARAISGETSDDARLGTPVDFKFSRELLRLTFKPLPILDTIERTRDITDEFPCQQSWDKLQTMGQNDTEDIMCIPRPKYLPHLKNPCYMAETKPGARRSNTIHCLPYFHILGNDKCGTTDFHARLTQHPRVLPNNGGIGKEIYYWCWLRYGLWMKRTIPKKRFHIYHMFFQVPTNLIINEYRKNKMQYITGDGTPMDFWDFRGWPEDPQNAGLSEPRFLTPHAMRHLYRDPKFIVMVRNPIDRLYSDYIFLGYGFTAQKFARDVPVAISMLQECLSVNSTRQCFFSDHMYHQLPMRIHISCYSVYLREWMSVFHKNHFLVLRTEDYHADMKGTLQRTYTFLDMRNLTEEEEVKVESQLKKHETVLKKKAGPMFAETRALLEEFFAPFNEDLTALLGDDRFLWKDR
ncbi:hypothetical protein RRG08_005426 [Elysia crispata]|uniref:Sulfotransferase domain-containing protein n=1 Tax=Elysia crispata TaxID=231223 RepID=A0AAE1CQU6_9GAST|nr:hypothetical protein RRG08_005426 [Elysia crispata]